MRVARAARGGMLVAIGRQSLTLTATEAIHLRASLNELWRDPDLELVEMSSEGGVQLRRRGPGQVPR